MTQAKPPTTLRAAAEPAAKTVSSRVARKPAGRAPSAHPSQAAAPEKVQPAAAPKAVAAPSDGGLAKPKHKLVRDSFTIPKSEYAVLDALKLRAAQLQRPTKKSEVLRAGIVALSTMSDKAFLAAINGVPSLKTGRPKAPALPTKTAAR